MFRSSASEMLLTRVIHFSEFQHGRAGMEDWYASLSNHAANDDRFTKSARARLMINK
jgi:hypothetical protein